MTCRIRDTSSVARILLLAPPTVWRYRWRGLEPYTRFGRTASDAETLHVPECHRRHRPTATTSSFRRSARTKLSLPAPSWRPGYLAVDSAGNLYVSDRGGRGFGGGCRIVRVSQTRVLSVVAGTGTCGFKGDGGQAIAAGYQLHVAKPVEPTATW